jgi:hypothetical protein
MFKDHSADPSILAEVIVTKIAERSERSSVTGDQVTPLIDALLQGLESVAARAIDDPHAGVEQQTSGLAKAVITDTADTLTPADTAAKREM